MKKFLNVILIFVLTFLLCSCFGKNISEDSLNDAKNEILNNSGTNGQDNKIPKYEDDINDLEKNKDDVLNYKETEDYTVKYLSGPNLIEIDGLDKQDFDGRKVEINGKTLGNVDKIVVNFSNSSSNFPDDRYTLSQFKSGDKKFVYRAYHQYQTLDYGNNEYIFEAYSGTEVSRVEVLIYLPKNIEKTVEQKNTKEENNINDNSFNISANSENTNSKIKGLTINKISPDLQINDSDKLNTFLIDNINGWFFWNSLKASEKLTTFYVVRLDGNNYVYEKHYYIPDGTHGVLFLEKGTGVDKDNINDANKELKDKNGQFDTEEADKFFNDLSK